MPQEAQIFRIQIFQNLPVTVMGQVRSLATGKLLVDADVATITYSVFDLEGATPDVAVTSGSVVVADAIHDLQLDDRWAEDRIGFNFDHTLLNGVFPQGGRVYALQYLFTAIGDSDPSGTLIFHVHVLNKRGQ